MNQSNALFTTEVDMKYLSLKCDLNYIPPDSNEYREIEEFILTSQVKSTSIKVIKIFGVRRESEVSSFSSHISNQRQLFHGSKVSNFVGLLSRGLLLPKVIVGLGGKRTNFGWLGSGRHVESIIVNFIEESILDQLHVLQPFMQSLEVEGRE